MHTSERFLSSVLLLAALTISGCGTAPAHHAADTGQPAHAPGEACCEGHGPLGPHGGHLVELDHAHYQAEWTHEDQTSKITVHVLDKRTEPSEPLAVEDVSFTIHIAGGSATEYALTAATAPDGTPLATQFTIEDPSLLTALQVGEGVEATLNLTINGQPLAAQIEHHQHAGHNH